MLYNRVCLCLRVFRLVGQSSVASRGGSPADLRGVSLTYGELNGEPVDTTSHSNIKMASNSSCNAGKMDEH